MNDVAFIDLKAAPGKTVAVPLVVTGVAKGAQALLQQVIILMMVSPNDPARLAGGSLAADFRTANISPNNLDQVRNLLAIAIKSVLGTIQTLQSTLTLTDAEKLSDIQLVLLQMPMPGSLTITLNVLTAAGASATGSYSLGGMANDTAN
jgi:hypothetical protein